MCVQLFALVQPNKMGQRKEELFSGKQVCDTGVWSSCQNASLTILCIGLTQVFRHETIYQYKGLQIGNMVTHSKTLQTGHTRKKSRKDEVQGNWKTVMRVTVMVVVGLGGWCNPT